MQKTAHIIGAGLSGLAAAIRLSNAGYVIHVHEATQQAGGRCRSYYDAATDLVIDNGNHLLLSGNHHARAYARSIGTEAGLVGPTPRGFRSSIFRPANAGRSISANRAFRRGYSTQSVACRIRRSATI